MKSITQFITQQLKLKVNESKSAVARPQQRKVMEELAPYMRGWRSYFGFCETPRVLGSLTCWVRARLRAALWRQWKTPRRRRAALLAMGVRPTLAKNTACSSRGPLYLAHAKALSVALPTAYFHSLGLPHLADGH